MVDRVNSDPMTKYEPKEAEAMEIENKSNTFDTEHDHDALGVADRDELPVNYFRSWRILGSLLVNSISSCWEESLPDIF
jgi:hypothetical protein